MIISDLFYLLRQVNRLKLFIAEKPSLGKAIAAALPKPHKNHKGFIEVGNGDIVTWCIGHVLEQADPEVYNEDYKKWHIEHLPIVPENWLLKPKSQTRSQLTVIRKLIKQASDIVHAGDPDREGQLLVDEVVDYLKVSQTKKRAAKRLLVNDLNTSAIKKSLNNMKDNTDFIPLSISALARSRADWLYGINLTRAYTLQGQKNGFNSVLSVGRVQTPILGLVVRRDEEIRNFVSHKYYEVHADIKTNSGENFTAKWRPSEACKPHMDDKNRIINKALAENVVERISNQPAEIVSLDEQLKKQYAPLPYNLSSLQIDAAKQFSMNAKLVLDVCQTLYEKHKLITYPRSDCRYLPNEHFSQAKTIIDLLSNSSHAYASAAKSANHKLKSKAWNDAKVNAHHAIIPTVKNAENISLNSFEKNIYQLIVRQYLIQFYPPYRFNQTSVILSIAGGNFYVNAKSPKDLGWKAVFQTSKNVSSANCSSHNNEFANDDALSEQSLPKLNQNDTLYCNKGTLIEKDTQPPKHFTDATLLGAMTGIARYVHDPEIKKILKETDGLGTEATRAGIIELLFKRNYLQRTGKIIKATLIGESLINALPEMATYPDMTAQWESTLNAISEKKANYQQFMNPLYQTLDWMISDAKQRSFSTLPKVAFKPKRKPRKKAYSKKKSAT